MHYTEVDFTGIDKADGLNESESLMLRQLVEVFNDRLPNNRRRMEYYEDKNRLKNIGLTIPGDIADKVDTHVGWAAKAVDFLCARSIFDNLSVLDEKANEELSDIFAANDFAVEYSKSNPTMLTHGMGLWTISKGGAGEPKSVINWRSATSSASLWDWRKKRIKCAFVVEDYELVSVAGKEEYRPSFVVLHTDYAVIEIARNGSKWWKAVRKPHMLGRCLAVPMAYRPQDTKPFGKSRISRTVMSITDEMQREILRTSLHAEVFASGQKALLGVSDEQFDALQGQKYRAAMTELFVATRDANGDIPQVTQFSQQSMEPHIKAMESLMARMSAETYVPAAAFGLIGNSGVYQSADSLRANSDDIILEAETLNRNNGKAIKEVATIALAIARNKTVEEIADIAKTIEVHWIDPSMPSTASVADATTKLAGIVPEFGGTDIFWELNGFNAEQRRRVRSEMRQNQLRGTVESIFSARQGEQ